MRFGRQSSRLSQSVQHHPAFQNPESWATLNFQDAELTIDDVIFLAFEALNDKRHNDPIMTTKIATELEKYINLSSQLSKTSYSRPQAASVNEFSTRTFSTVTQRFAISTSSPLTRIQSPVTALWGWRLPMVKRNRLGLAKSFNFSLRMMRKL